MALIEFQNNQPPYINASNLNHNFNELNKNNIFLGEEIDTGKTYKGAKIYRQIINGITSETAGTWKTIGSAIPNISKVVNLYGIIGGYLPVPTYVTANYTCALQYSRQDGVQVHTNGYTNAEIEVVIEYLKSS